MKKRILCLLITFILLVTSVPALGYEGTLFNNSDYTCNELEDGTLEVSFHYQDQEFEEFHVPDTIGGKKVSMIWNISCKGLKRLYVPEGIKSISDVHIADLEEVVLPNSLEIIQQCCFEGCTNLKRVTMPDNVLIDQMAFQNDKNLSEINFVENNEEKTTSSSLVIGYQAFDGCTSLKDFVIPEGYKEIGPYAFKNCSNLEIDEIPESVEFIRNGAFIGCEKIKKINIKGKLKEDSGDGFVFNYSSVLKEINFQNAEYIPSNFCKNCFALKKVTFSNKLKCIQEQAFDGCFSLKKVIIPKSLEKIDTKAFQACFSIPSINIPKKVDKIGDNAFAYCGSLKSITVDRENKYYTSMDGNLYNKAKTNLIKYAVGKTKTDFNVPNTVQTISPGAFNTGCKGEVSYDEYSINAHTNLKEITIQPSVVEMIGCELHKDVKIFGYEGSAAEIYAFSTGNEFFSIGRVGGRKKPNSNNNTIVQLKMTAIDKSIFQKSDAYWNENQESYDIKDWTIEYKDSLGKDKSFKSRNSTHVVDYDDVLSDIDITCYGYSDYRIPSEVMRSWSMNCIYNHNVFLEEDDDENKVINVYARLHSEYDIDQHPYTEVRTNGMATLPSCTYDVILETNFDPNYAGEYTYYLAQDDKHIISSKDGKFYNYDLYSAFNDFKTVWAYAEDKDGNATKPVQVLFQKGMDGFIDQLNHGELNFIPSGKEYFSINGTGSILDGLSMKFIRNSLPLGVQICGDRILVSIGTDIFHPIKEIPNSLKTNHREVWEDFKAQLSESHRLMSIRDIANNPELAKTASKDLFKENNVNPFYCSHDVYGYFELAYSDNGLGAQLTSFGAEVNMEARFKVVANYLVADIPVYFYAKGGADAKGYVNHANLFEKCAVPVQFDLILDIYPYLSAGAGIGVESVLALGPYGEVALPIHYDFNKQHLVVDLVGSAGIEADFLVLENRIPCFMNNETYHVFDRHLGDNYGSSKSIPGIDKYVKNIKLKAEKNAFSALSRNYANQTSEWLGDNKTDSAKKIFNYTDLQKKVYNNSQCQIAKFGDKYIMTWIQDPGADVRTDENRMRLVYSIYSDEDGWSEPKPVDDDGTNDLYPSLASDGNSVYLAWQNITTDEPDDVSNYIHNTEICFASLNLEDEEFKTEDIKHINIEGYQYEPSVSVKNGKGKLTFVNNKTYLSEIAGKNDIYTCEYGQKETTVYRNKNYIIDLTSTYDDISYIMDKDGDGETTDDILIYTGNKELDGYDPSVLNIKYFDFNNEKSLFFTDGSLIYYIENGEVKTICEETNGTVSNISVVKQNNKDTVLWTVTGENGSVIKGSIYENEAWGEPIEFSDFSSNITNLVATSKDGVIKGVFNKTKDNNTDLCQFDLNKYTDVSVERAEIIESEIGQDGNCEVYVLAKNNGFSNIKKLNINIKDSDNSSRTYTKNVDIAPGDMEAIELDYKLSDISSSENITVEVSADNDYDDSNNSYEFEIGYTDINITETKIVSLGDKYLLTGEIENKNNVPAENVSLSIKYGEESDAKNTVIDIGTVNGKESTSFDVVFTDDDFELIDGNCLVELNAYTTTAEDYEENNKDATFVPVYNFIDTEAELPIDHNPKSKELNISGFQLNTSNYGVKTIYSVPSKINDTDVVEKGLVYGIEGYYSSNDLRCNSSNRYIYSYKSGNGISADGTYSMTMTNPKPYKNSPLYIRNVYVRAYAKLSDGTYVYSSIRSYSPYKLADYLYRNKHVANEEQYNFIYNNILHVVNPNYTEEAYNGLGYYVQASHLKKERNEEEICKDIIVKGYQMDLNNYGIKTIFEMPQYINDKKVEGCGIIYGIETLCTEDDLYINSSNSKVYSYVLTGTSRYKNELNGNDIYATTMTNPKPYKGSKLHTLTVYVKIYAKLSDGTYVYSDINDYSFYNVADYLYKENLMRTEEMHKKLYDNVLHIMNPDYKEIAFSNLGWLTDPNELADYNNK
ncbi:MAG: leucine-rich repeat domain-containing protein [Lachnospiraceae bacterium]|nr:leucine-rich repeat domain-containing protein [Lachnospiraceae bacterium]